MKKFIIKPINPSSATKLCKSITATLPEWFGQPKTNEQYAQGMLERISFAASIDDELIGMITLEFPYPNNGNIYWMAVKKKYHGQKIGTRLIRAAENYCREQGCHSLTVETLSSKQNDPNYLKTYNFYKHCGFNPLFEMNTHDANNLMVYMQKLIDFKNVNFIDLTHTLSSEIPTWGGGCGFQHKIKVDYTDCSGEVKFRVHHIEMNSGIGTHIDAPAHCIQDGLGISDIPLESLIVPCVVIDVSKKIHERYSLSPEDITEYENEYGKILNDTFVIVYTGWDQFWTQPKKYRNKLIFPSISKQAAELLLERGITGLGIDTLSPDRAEDNFPVHQLMLGAGKYIIENIANAKSLPPVGASICILPIKIKEGTEAPVRVIGMLMGV